MDKLKTNYYVMPLDSDDNFRYKYRLIRSHRFTGTAVEDVSHPYLCARLLVCWAYDHITGLCCAVTAAMQRLNIFFQTTFKTN